MRTPSALTEVNGPRTKELQAERAERVRKATERAVDPAIIAKQHGDRLAARAAQNN